MAKVIQGGPLLSDPLGELRDAVDTMRDELSDLQTSIKADHEWIKGALKEILQELESKSDSD
jgi:hypothetical protein